MSNIEHTQDTNPMDLFDIIELINKKIPAGWNEEEATEAYEICLVHGCNIYEDPEMPGFKEYDQLYPEPLMVIPRDDEILDYAQTLIKKCDPRAEIYINSLNRL